MPHNGQPTIDELAVATAELHAAWRDRAACKGLGRIMDPPEHRLNDRTIRQAKAICAACPVLTDCARWVLALPPSVDVAGVCGGLTAAERDQLRLIPPAVTIAPGHKICRRCRQAKPVGEFYRDSRNADGRNSYCKPCNYELKTIRRARKSRTAPHTVDDA